MPRQRPLPGLGSDDIEVSCLKNVGALKNMRRRCILVLVGCLGILCIVFVSHTRKRDEERKRMRAELQMLDIIRGGVSSELETGSALPTNWISLSNVVNWGTLTRMWQDGFIPPATEAYAVLSKTIYLSNHFHSGSVFLVGSKLRTWPGLGSGRWVLVSSSNGVFRIWIPEDRLPPEIRSQLTNR